MAEYEMPDDAEIKITAGHIRRTHEYEALSAVSRERLRALYPEAFKLKPEPKPKPKRYKAGDIFRHKETKRLAALYAPFPECALLKLLRLDTFEAVIDLGAQTYGEVKPIGWGPDGPEAWKHLPLARLLIAPDGDIASAVEWLGGEE